MISNLLEDKASVAFQAKLSVIYIWLIILVFITWIHYLCCVKQPPLNKMEKMSSELKTDVYTEVKMFRIMTVSGKESSSRSDVIYQ